MHADYGYSTPCQVLHFLTWGEFNQFGFNSDVPLTLTQNSDGKWQPEIMDGWPSSIQLNVYHFYDYFYGDTMAMAYLTNFSQTLWLLTLSICPPCPNLTSYGLWLWTTLRWAGCLSQEVTTGGEGAWKPTKTSWVHGRLWLKVPTTYPPITDWVHSKCTQIMCSTWNLWEHLYSIWNVKSTCMPHLIPHNS